MKRLRIATWAGLGLLTLAAGGAGLAATVATEVDAADHLDPPARTNPTAGGTDRNADIADLYAWHRGTGASASVVAVLSFSGPNMPVADQAIPCDRDVLYSIHVSNDDDLMPEFTISARFGLDDLDNCFVQLSGIPGAGATPIVTRVERTATRDGVSAYAGLRDDAFFFDLQGFQQTLTTGTISMTDDREFFAGQNTPALVVEFPLVAVSPGGETLRVWATTSRAGS